MVCGKKNNKNIFIQINNDKLEHLNIYKNLGVTYKETEI